jgi:hypothetical protein
MTAQEIKDTIQDSGSDARNMDKLRDVLVDIKDDLAGAVVLEVFQGLTAQGASNATTSVMGYGVNIFTSSTTLDYATKLPQPSTGMTTKIINNSPNIIMVYPSNVGGKINNLAIDAPLLIPANGILYEFVCTLNPLPGNWNTIGSLNGTPLVFLDFEINHTQGTSSYILGNPGDTSSGVANMITSGNVATVSTTGGCTQGVPTCNVLINGTASTLRSEPGFTTLNNIKVETNVISSDTDGSNGQKITFNVLRSYVYDYFNISNGVQMVSIGGAEFSAGDSDSVPIGGVAGGNDIGDVGTQFRDSLGFLGTGNYQSLRSIGAPASTYTSGGITSNSYYYLSAFVQANAATKVYKFRVTFTLD